MCVVSSLWIFGPVFCEIAVCESGCTCACISVKLHRGVGLLSPSGLPSPGSVGELLMAQILPKWQLCFPGLKVGGPKSPLLGPFSLSGWSLFWFEVLNTLMLPSAKKLHLQWSSNAFRHWPRHTASFEECSQWDGIYLRRPKKEGCLWRHSVNMETELGWDNACFSLLFAYLLACF